MVKPVFCESCGKELIQGDKVVRIQQGSLYYVKHVGIERKANTDDYFCADCKEKGLISVRP